MMKAVRIHAYGDTGVLRFEDAPLPEIGPKDVLVRVVATSINPVDWKIRQGHLQKMLAYPLPFTLGLDASGVVAAIGAEVTRFKLGDAVFSRPAIHRNGTYAEFVAIAEAEVAMKPATISHVEAATLPLVSITAWEVLVTAAGLTAGQRVLIHGGSGGVGSIAVQLAKARGAYVIATTSARNIGLVRSIGADEVLDYHNTVLRDVVGDLDVVFDTIGGDTQAASWALLKKGGILVSIVSPPSEELAQAHGVRKAFVFIDPNAAILAEVATLVDAGAIRPLIGAEFALSDIAKAHALSETGRAQGKIAIYVGQP